MNLDRPKNVRPGEELDLPRLTTFLATHGIPGPVTVEQFPGGFSNLTYLVRAGSGAAVRELVLRRPPFGANVRGGHDMGREYRVLARLTGRYAKAPRPVAYSDDEGVLGAPFYLMERVRGVILRGGLAPRDAPPPATMRGLSASFAGDLAALHAIDPQAAGLGDLGRPAGYVERQVRGWGERYVKARTDDVPAVERAARWLDEHRPPHESGASVVHNDFKLDNLVLDPDDLTRIVAVLDWEMATLGDPLMDLGTTLAYWFDPDDPPELLGNAVRGPTTLPGTLPRIALVEAYARASGRDVEDVLFYYVFGLFKLAVIAQQIYARFRHGHTTDPRFAALGKSVEALGGVAERAIALGRIDRLGG